jgi:hypothetical protein
MLSITSSCYLCQARVLYCSRHHWRVLAPCSSSQPSEGPPVTKIPQLQQWRGGWGFVWGWHSLITVGKMVYMQLPKGASATWLLRNKNNTSVIRESVPCRLPNLFNVPHKDDPYKQNAYFLLVARLAYSLLDPQDVLRFFETFANVTGRGGL